jgi:hypothetical protein
MSTHKLSDTADTDLGTVEATNVFVRSIIFIYGIFNNAAPFKQSECDNVVY